MVKASLLPLANTVLVSNNFPAGRTTIGHVVRDGDYVIVAHKDRCFIGRLIGAAAYEAQGFDPFAVIAELPAADAVFRAAVRWGEALAGTADPVRDAGAKAAPGDVELLWRAPSDALAIALARALFLAGTIGQRRATYFSLSLQDLHYRRSVLTCFVDNDGQSPPVALLAVARALPEAWAESLSVEFALSRERPLERCEQIDAEQTRTPVGKPGSPVPLPTPSISRSKISLHQGTLAAAADPQTQEGAMPPPSGISPPKAEMLSLRRSPRFSAGPWWLAPVATGAVALLSVAWIWNETRVLGGLRSDAERTVETAKAALADVQRLAAETANSAKSAAEAAKSAADGRVTAANDAALSKAALTDVQRLAAEAAKSAASAAEAAKSAADGRVATAGDVALSKAALADVQRLATEGAKSAASAAEAARSAADSRLATAGDVAFSKAALANVQRLAAEAAKSAASAAEAAKSAADSRVATASDVALSKAALADVQRLATEAAKSAASAAEAAKSGKAAESQRQ